jgi:hypothetical protein
MLNSRITQYQNVFAERVRIKDGSMAAALSGIFDHTLARVLLTYVLAVTSREQTTDMAQVPYIQTDADSARHDTEGYRL